MNGDPEGYYAAETFLITHTTTEEGCPPGDSIHLFDMGVQLVTPLVQEGDDPIIGPQYELYPIDDYAGTNEIFSCRCFSETCNLCTPPGQNCDPNANTDPIYNVPVCMDCRECNDQTGGQWNGSGYEFRDVATAERKVKHEVKLVPNPFQDEVVLSGAFATGTEVEVRIFDAQGKQMRQLAFQADGSTVTQRIETNGLPNGIYYFQVRSAAGINTLKMAKLRE